MGNIPKFKTAVLTTDDKVLFDVDMGKVLLSLDKNRAKITLNKMLENRNDFNYIPIHVGLSEENKEFNLYSPTINNKAEKIYRHEDALSFVEAIGGVNGLDQYFALNNCINSLERKRERMSQYIIDVGFAEFVPYKDYKGDYVYDEEFVEIDSMLLKYTIPTEIKEITNDADRYKASDEWLRSNACPFAYCTYKAYWGGLSSEDITYVWEDIYDPEGDIDAMQPELLKELINRVKEGAETQVNDEFFEDASSLIANIDSLDVILGIWFENKGSASDAEIEQASNLVNEALKAWNEEQNVSAYYQDTMKVVGLFQDVDLKECVQYLKNKYEQISNEIEILKNSWLPALNKEVNELTNFFENKGILLFQCYYSKDYKVRRFSEDKEIVFPTLELANQYALKVMEGE